MGLCFYNNDTFANVAHMITEFHENSVRSRVVISLKISEKNRPYTRRNLYRYVRSYVEKLVT
jgi:hypothetical protein